MSEPFLISEIINLLNQAMEEFGDMPVGAYSAEYCYELSKAEDLMGISLRVMTSYGDSSASNLPGIDLMNDNLSTSDNKFLTIFYNDK